MQRQLSSFLWSGSDCNGAVGSCLAGAAFCSDAEGAADGVLATNTRDPVAMVALCSPRWPAGILGSNPASISGSSPGPGYEVEGNGGD